MSKSRAPLKALLAAMGVQPGSLTAAEFEQFVANERKKYGAFISELGIQME